MSFKNLIILIAESEILGFTTKTAPELKSAPKQKQPLDEDDPGCYLLFIVILLISKNIFAEVLDSLHQQK